MIRVLAISGSLRRASSTTAVVRAARLVAPGHIEVVVYTGLAGLPPFNPDDDGELLPAPVADLRAQIAAADAVLISSPEYAHGVPGVLKNALDWLVGGMEMVGKPVALINASPRATIAQAQLAETLRTMQARVIDDASVTLPLLGVKIDEFGIAASPDLASLLQNAIEALTEPRTGGHRIHTA
jgi:NAD(P)H-dependent FMN reductase